MQTINPSQRLAQRFDPPCLRYWERRFRTLHMWPHWLKLRSVVEEQYRIAQHHLECSFREAKVATWLTYIEVTTAKDDSLENPFYDAHIDLVCSIRDIEMPLFLCHLSIGTDIQRGCSEREALELYQHWLQESPTNPIFGDWGLTNELRVVPVQTLLKQQSKTK